MRKLAKIVTIDATVPIEGADAIELAIVGGWQVVVKKGEFTPGACAIYIEIDSFLREGVPAWDFLQARSQREFLGVKGHVLKTIRLRKQLSQGLLLPISAFFQPEDEGMLAVDLDVTEILGIVKYEAPDSFTQNSQARGNFPGWIQKTDEERVQNLTRTLEAHQGETWFVREKIDGSSTTFYLDTEGEFGVCSRNLDLKESEGNPWWEMARKYNVEEKMRERNLLGIAIQGETYGFGMNGNKYGLPDRHFAGFTVQERGVRMSETAAHALMATLGLPVVPVALSESILITNPKTMLAQVNNLRSVINPQVLAEGIVVRNPFDSTQSFKVISNAWLEKYKE